jgi:hypothetical protein
MASTEHGNDFQIKLPLDPHQRIEWQFDSNWFPTPGLVRMYRSDRRAEPTCNNLPGLPSERGMCQIVQLGSGRAMKATKPLHSTRNSARAVEVSASLFTRSKLRCKGLSALKGFTKPLTKPLTDARASHGGVKGFERFSMRLKAFYSCEQTRGDSGRIRRLPRR